jgi:HK97 family phage prohead protease
MTGRAIDIEDFHRQVAAGEQPTAAVGVQFKFATGAAEANSRTITFRFSDNSIDTYNDSIAADGWEWDKVRGVPALFGHDPTKIENVVGRGKNIRVIGNSLIGDIEFADASVSPTADAVFKLVRGGFVNTCSVGFQPLIWEQTKDKTRPGGLDFKKQRLLEVSVVPLPANSNAVALARAAGIDVDRLALMVTEPGQLSASEIARVRQMLDDTAARRREVELLSVSPR